MYQRKTMDTWEIYQLMHCGTWESVCTEMSRHRACVNIKLYRENQPEYMCKLVPKRISLKGLDAKTIAGYEDEAYKGRMEGYEAAKQRREGRKLLASLALTN